MADVGCLIGYTAIRPFRDPSPGYRTARHRMVHFRSCILQGPCAFFPCRLFTGSMANWYRSCKKPARTTFTVGTDCDPLPGTKQLSPCPNLNLFSKLSVHTMASRDWGPFLSSFAACLTSSAVLPYASSTARRVLRNINSLTSSSRV